jgi:ribosomal protein S18 acetylase RimI-like enzyme
VLPDAFLDGRDIVPPAAFWIGRAGVPPSRRHSLLVLGRPGQVLGYCDSGPCRDSDVDVAVTGEVYELYLDPTATGAGAGRRLLERATVELVASGSTDLRLWVLEANRAGRAFYEACGWAPDGAARSEDLGLASFDELRYRAGPSAM